MFAISCLTIFLQANWTGPPIDFNNFDAISNDFKDIMTSLVGISDYSLKKKQNKHRIVSKHYSFQNFIIIAIKIKI